MYLLGKQKNNLRYLDADTLMYFSASVLKWTGT